MWASQKYTLLSVPLVHLKGQFIQNDQSWQASNNRYIIPNHSTDTVFKNSCKALFYCFTTRKWKYTKYYNITWIDFLVCPRFFSYQPPLVWIYSMHVEKCQLGRFLHSFQMLTSSELQMPLYLNNLSIYIISGNAQFSLEQRKATPHDCITLWVWNTAKWAVRACIQKQYILYAWH